MKMPRDLVVCDCVGANAQWFALRELFHAGAEKGVKFAFHNKMGSEDPGSGGDAPRRFNAVNCRPQFMADDLEAELL
jgi:hypothetical protein